MNRGFWAAVAAFLIWGMLPLYLHALRAIPPVEIMAHRLLWCCAFVHIWLAARGQLGGVRLALQNPSTRRRLAVTAILVSGNWLVYVWGVGSGHAVEASLGYFINPLVNVLLGVFVLHERLNRVQWSAVALAVVGVLYLTWLAGAPPWIALTLALTFGVYGLMRKMMPVEAIAGLAAETLLIAPLGLAYLLWLGARGHGAFGHETPTLDGLLILGGLVTAVPLALFAYGARLIPYSTLGLIQYLGPSLQLLIAIFVFHEPFGAARAIGFGLIWAALALYAGDGLLRARHLRRAAPRVGARAPASS